MAWIKKTKVDSIPTPSPPTVKDQEIEDLKNELAALRSVSKYVPEQEDTNEYEEVEEKTPTQVPQKQSSESAKLTVSEVLDVMEGNILRNLQLIKLLRGS